MKDSAFPTESAFGDNIAFKGEWQKLFTYILDEFYTASSLRELSIKMFLLAYLNVSVKQYLPFASSSKTKSVISFTYTSLRHYFRKVTLCVVLHSASYRGIQGMYKEMEEEQDEELF